MSTLFTVRVTLIYLADDYRFCHANFWIYFIPLKNPTTDLHIGDIFNGIDIGGEFGPWQTVFPMDLQDSPGSYSDKLLPKTVHLVFTKVTYKIITLNCD